MIDEWQRQFPESEFSSIITWLSSPVFVSQPNDDKSGYKIDQQAAWERVSPAGTGEYQVVQWLPSATTYAAKSVDCAGSRVSASGWVVARETTGDHIARQTCPIRD